MAFPKMSAGSGKPKPFSRPGVNLDRPSRQWAQVTVASLTLGDIVPDLGEITDMRMLGGTEYMHLTGAGGKTRTFTPSELVFAFTNAK